MTTSTLEAPVPTDAPLDRRWADVARGLEYFERYLYWKAAACLIVATIVGFSPHFGFFCHPTQVDMDEPGWGALVGAGVLTLSLWLVLSRLLVCMMSMIKGLRSAPDGERCEAGKSILARIASMGGKPEIADQRRRQRPLMLVAFLAAFLVLYPLPLLLQAVCSLCSNTLGFITFVGLLVAFALGIGSVFCRYATLLRQARHALACVIVRRGLEPARVYPWRQLDRRP